MKTNLVWMAVLVVAAATMGAPAFAGEYPPDWETQWEMQKGNPAEKVEAGTRPAIPDAKDYKYRTGIETGNLPSDADRNPAVDFSKDIDGGG